MAGVRRLFAELPGASLGELTAGPIACLWAAGPQAPVDVDRDGDRFAILLGYAVDEAGTWSTARRLADAWFADRGERAGHDGYHVAVAWDPARGLVAGVDPLAFFPLYHASLADGSLMVTTTPQVFLAHPLVRWRIDRQGLAGVLFAHGLLDDRPLLAGAKRVSMGHRLWASSDGPGEERQFFEFTGTPAPTGERFAESCERITAELLGALRRHRPPGDDTALMLSGGLDSRLVAGCLADLGIPTRAVTFGRPRDHEVRAAMAVAHRLGMPIERVSTEEADTGFVDRTRRAVRFSHLSSGPGGDDFAEGLANAATEARFHWSGVPFDWVFEPVSNHSGYDPVRGRFSVDLLLTHMNSWGIPSASLPALLGSDGRQLCDALIDNVHDVCRRGPLPPERQAAVVRWDQRVRNHLAAALHRTSFTAWPLLPATDRRFLNTIFGLPVPTFADRRLEKEILVARRPDLAAIPLDTNSFTFEPLPGTMPSGPPLARLTRSLMARGRRALQPLLPIPDPRRYERLFDVDQPRWLAVRHAVEPLRPLLADHLEPRILAGLLPPPHRRLRSRTPLRSGSPIRLLAGLAFLLDQ